MTEWRNGARKTDASGQMPHIAKQLGDADVAALAAYFSALPVPAPASKMVNIAAGSVQRPAVADHSGAGPKAAPAATGTGTEQGSPLTGGGQGPGGGGGARESNPGAAGRGRLEHGRCPGKTDRATCPQIARPRPLHAAHALCVAARAQALQ